MLHLANVLAKEDAMKPAYQFEFMRADEVAECWDGVSEELYAALWNKVVPYQKAIPNLEDSGPADHVGHENLAAHWHRLTEEEQVELNRLAVRQDELLGKYEREHGL